MERFTQTEDQSVFEEVLQGLRQSRKKLPSKLFYDRRGSELFEQICATDEYYLTDTELQIMEKSIHDISEILGTGIHLIELGSGSSYKTRLLLDHLEEVRSYVPVDISDKFLQTAVQKLQKEYPHLQIVPVAGDYTRSLTLPEEVSAGTGRRVIYFPGSTIGNFTPQQARKFLRRIAEAAGGDGGLLIGVDLKKDPEMLEKAYNDSENITAEFNKNILRRLNRELGADFDPDKFTHHAFFNKEESRIEMHLVSLENQKIRIGNEVCRFRKGESIHTENSYKYSPEVFEKLTEGLFKVKKNWTDEYDYVSVQYLEVDLQ